jgi:GT2 family glycosyltransferase
LDGWVVGPGEVEGVRIVDGTGREHSCEFSFYEVRREDVVRAVSSELRSGERVIGYRLLVAYDASELRPTLVILRLGNGLEHRQVIGKKYVSRMTWAQKRQLMTTTPVAYGLSDPIGTDPNYVNALLRRAERLGDEEEERAFRRGIVDGWIGLGANRVVLFGWIDDGGCLGSVGEAGIEGAALELPVNWLRYVRRDLKSAAHVKLGFICLLHGVGRVPPYVVSVRDELGKGVELEVGVGEQRESEMVSIMLVILGLWGAESIDEAQMQSAQSIFIEPIQQLLHRKVGAPRAADEREWGRPADNPDVSIVVPIYKAYELVRHQLEDFASDPYVARQDIVLVLDSPEDRQWFLRLLDACYQQYGLSVRLLTMAENGGFAVACNAGAGIARAPYLLMLNSDVLSSSHGWLESLVHVLRERSEVGVVGARLLYPDGSIQHDGIGFGRHPLFRGLWINEHPCKGMPVWMGEGSGIYEVEAVTGACMLMRTEEFLKHGGFDVGYLRGDFEDADYCLAQRRQGKVVVCDRSTTLFHLEGASYPVGDRSSVFLYNAMRFNGIWARHLDCAVSDGGRRIPGVTGAV